MILEHPATLGVIAWLVLTVALVVAFSGRGVSAAFGMSTSLIRGVRDWARGPEPNAERAASSGSVELPPLPAPGSLARGPVRRTINAGAAARWRVPHAEIEDLESRRLS